MMWSGHAQSNVFDIELKISSSQKQGAFTVEIKSQKEKKKLNSNLKGILVINSVSYGEVYELILSKNNYVTKTIKIDAQKGYYKDEVSNDVVELDIEMIEALLYVDYGVVTNFPVGIIEIGSESGRLENNTVFAVKRKNEIDTFLETTNDLSRDLQDHFNQSLKDAKKQIENNNFKTAESLIQEAEEIAVNTDTEEVRTLLKGAVLRDGDEQDAITKIISVADTLLAEENYTKSLGLFKRVLRLDPENVYAQEKVNEINVLLVNMETDKKKMIDYKTSTSEILARAMKMQENRIEGYYNR